MQNYLRRLYYRLFIQPWFDKHYLVVDIKGPRMSGTDYIDLWQLVSYSDTKVVMGAGSDARLHIQRKKK